MPQSLAQIYIHLVFSTKNREPLLLSPLREELHAYLAGIFSNLESPAIEIGGMSDHVHAVFRQSKNLPLAKIVEEVKTTSSRWIKTRQESLGNFHWQSGYAGFSINAAQVKDVSKYISQQQRHHRVMNFQDEFRRFMNARGIEYDERYVWD